MTTLKRIFSYATVMAFLCIPLRAGPNEDLFQAVALGRMEQIAEAMKQGATLLAKAKGKKEGDPERTLTAYAIENKQLLSLVYLVAIGAEHQADAITVNWIVENTHVAGALMELKTLRDKYKEVAEIAAMDFIMAQAEKSFDVLKSGVQLWFDFERTIKSKHEQHIDTQPLRRLYTAIIKNDMPGIIAALEEGADINEHLKPETTGYVAPQVYQKYYPTAFHYAMNNKRYVAAIVLIAYGAFDIDKDWEWFNQHNFGRNFRDVHDNAREVMLEFKRFCVADMARCKEVAKRFSKEKAAFAERNVYALVELKGSSSLSLRAMILEAKPQEIQDMYEAIWDKDFAALQRAMGEHMAQEENDRWKHDDKQLFQEALSEHNYLAALYLMGYGKYRDYDLQQHQFTLDYKNIQSTMRQAFEDLVQFQKKYPQKVTKLAEFLLQKYKADAENEAFLLGAESTIRQITERYDAKKKAA